MISGGFQEAVLIMGRKLLSRRRDSRKDVSSALAPKLFRYGYNNSASRNDMDDDAYKQTFLSYSTSEVHMYSGRNDLHLTSSY